MTGEAKRRRGLRSLWPAGLWLLLCAAAPGSAQQQNPLEPLDTSSPRATVTTFLETMNEATTLYREKGDREGARARAFDAVRCLDLSEVPPTIAEAVSLETALQLKEILDRIPLPSPRHIPDAEAMDEELWGSWSIPDTEIAIAQVSEGPRSGEYLFSPQTVQRSAEYYDRVRDLPYRPSAAQTLRSLFAALDERGIRLVVAQVLDDVDPDDHFKLQELFGKDAFYGTLDDVVEAYREALCEDAG